MSELIWWPAKGWGFQEGTFEYGEDYFQEFQGKDSTNVGRILTTARAQFVNAHLPASRTNLVDVGIGGGAFLIAMACKGVDINKTAMKWLEGMGAAWDDKEASAMTFWDSLEHIPHPDAYLSLCSAWAFISTPIYESAEHVIHSKHYKPGEHLWYFTDRGLKRFMAEAGFALVSQNRMEENAGRDGIGTYAFRRI